MHKLPTEGFLNQHFEIAKLKIEQVENLVYISKQMGYSSPVVTTTVYAHMINATNYESACGLEEMIFGNNGNKTVAR